MEADSRLVSKWQSLCWFHKVEKVMTLLCTRKSIYKIILLLVHLQPNLFLIIAYYQVFTCFLMTCGPILSSDYTVSEHVSVLYQSGIQPKRRIFLVFLRPPANARIVPCIKSRPLPISFFLNLLFTIILHFYPIQWYVW